MSISQIYKSYAKQQLMWRLAIEGKVPSPETIEVANKELLIVENIGDAPLLKSVEDFAPYASLYVEDFNKMISYANADLKLLAKSYVDSYRKIVDNSELWDSLYENQRKKLRDLEDKVDLLLFREANSDGFLYGYSEYLNDDSNIESLENLELSEVITLKKTSSDMLEVPSSASISYAGTVGAGQVSMMTGTRLSSMLEDNENVAILVGRSNVSSHMKVVLDLRFPVAKKISYVELMKGDSINVEGRARCYVRLSNGDYKEFGNERALVDSLCWSGEPVETTHIRFSLEKYLHDRLDPVGGYIYTLSFKRIFVSKGNLIYVPNGTFISKPYNIHPTNKVAISVCDVNSDSTNIRYYLKPNNQDWVEVTPVNKEPGTAAYILSNNSTVKIDNLSTYSDKVDAAISAMKLINYVDYPEVVLPAGNLYLLNSYIASENVDPNSIEIWEDYVVGSSTDRIKGWLVKESTLETTLWIDGNETIEFNVGPYVVKVNGESQSGLIRLAGGRWLLEIPKESYSFSVEGAASEVELRATDHLYPYNLKHVFEGYSYGPGYTGVKLYGKSMARAAKRLVRKQTFNSFYEDSSSYFVAKSQEGNRYVVVNKNSDIYQTLYDYKLSYNVSENRINQVSVKAVMNSRAPEVSPVLLSYTIRAGF